MPTLAVGMLIRAPRMATSDYRRGHGTHMSCVEDGVAPTAAYFAAF